MEAQGVPNTIGKMRSVLREFPKFAPRPTHPSVYFDVLKALVGFLVKVAARADANKMDSHNLALSPRRRR